MLKRVCFLVGQSFYDLKNAWTQELCQALERRGIETSIIDIPSGALNKNHLEHILATRPDLTCTFSTLLPFSHNVLLCDFLKIPHLTLLAEPAIYSLHLSRSPYSIVGCVDYFDCELFHNAHTERVFFFPHAVRTELLLEPPVEKIYDAVFIGSCYDPAEVRNAWPNLYPSEVIAVLDKATALVLSDDHTSFTQALVEAWRISKIDPDGYDFAQLCREVDRYVRAIGRLELLRSITDVDVHVFGSAGLEKSYPHSRTWEQLLHSRSNITIHPALDRAGVWTVLKQSKICLDNYPCFKHGTHERTILGLAAGNLVLCDANRYVDAHFGEERGVVAYLHGQWDFVNERLKYYLSHETERQAIVERGIKTVGLEHTWDVRAEEFLKQIPQYWDLIAEDHYIRSFDTPR